jgi:hypothetical protein
MLLEANRVRPRHDSILLPAGQDIFVGRDRFVIDAKAGPFFTEAIDSLIQVIQLALACTPEIRVRNIAILTNGVKKSIHPVHIAVICQVA